jgi:hypothetical protein
MNDQGRSIVLEGQHNVELLHDIADTVWPVGTGITIQLQPPNSVSNILIVGSVKRTGSYQSDTTTFNFYNPSFAHALSDLAGYWGGRTIKVEVLNNGSDLFIYAHNETQVINLKVYKIKTSLEEGFGLSVFDDGVSTINCSEKNYQKRKVETLSSGSTLHDELNSRADDGSPWWGGNNYVISGYYNTQVIPVDQVSPILFKVPSYPDMATFDTALGILGNSAGTNVVGLYTTMSAGTLLNYYGEAGTTPCSVSDTGVVIKDAGGEVTYDSRCGNLLLGTIVTPKILDYFETPGVSEFITIPPNTEFELCFEACDTFVGDRDVYFNGYGALVGNDGYTGDNVIGVAGFTVKNGKLNCIVRFPSVPYQITTRSIKTPFILGTNFMVLE